MEAEFLESAKSVGIGCIVLLMIFFVFKSIELVGPFKTGLVERFGKYQRTVDSGITVVIPLIETIRMVDKREQLIQIAPQKMITKGNTVVIVEALIYYIITDPVRATYEVSDFRPELVKLALANLNRMVGELGLDEALVSGKDISTRLRRVLDEKACYWGVKVTNVDGLEEAGLSIKAEA